MKATIAFRDPIRFNFISPLADGAEIDCCIHPPNINEDPSVADFAQLFEEPSERVGRCRK